MLQPRRMWSQSHRCRRGRVVINPEPAAMNSTAPWTLTGPNSYIQTGTGDQTVNNLTVGNYTITWGAVTGWTSPAQATKALTNGGTTTFIGTYVQQTGTVVINPSPNSITAPWTLTGPNGFSRTSAGDQTLSNLAVGSYRITWGAVPSWAPPVPAVKTLTNGGKIAFNGTYVYQTIPVIQVTPSSLYFGYVPVESMKYLFLTVKNTGTGTLTGNATTSPPFGIVSGGSYSLGSAKEQTVTIRYQPTSADTHTGTVVFTGGAGVTVPVTGKTEKPLGLPWLNLLLEN